MDSSDKNRCRICGLDLGEPPWGEDEKCAMYIICECCGAESGIQDYSVKSCREYRENWLSRGGRFREPKYKPADWSLEEQLTHIPRKYL